MRSNLDQPGIDLLVLHQGACLCLLAVSSQAGCTHKLPDARALNRLKFSAHLLCRLALLLQENARVEEFARYPGHVFLSRDCIETLHEVLDIQVNCVLNDTPVCQSTAN